MNDQNGPKMIGVLLLEYGEPASLDDIPEYLRLHYGGYTPPPEAIAYLEERCRQVWGGPNRVSVPDQIAAALADELARRDPERYRVALAARYWNPYVEEALPQLAEAGYHTIVMLPLSPFSSHMAMRSIHNALERARQKCTIEPKLSLIADWGRLPGFLDTFTARTRAALEQFPAKQRDEVTAVFCAHSVAESAQKPETEYRQQLEESSAAVMAATGLRTQRLAFYSAEGPGQWLGPDVVELLDQLHAEGGGAALYIPIGNVYDNVELIYELETRIPQRAAELGIQTGYSAMPNAAPEFIAGLADLVVQTAESA